MLPGSAGVFLKYWLRGVFCKMLLPVTTFFLVQRLCFWSTLFAAWLQQKVFKYKLDILPTSEHLRFFCFLTLLTLRAYPGRNIWMEIVQKLVAVFLVSVVASANGLQLSVAITLMMAATSAMVQPYARPQVRVWAGFSDDFSIFHAFPRLCLSSCVESKFWRWRYFKSEIHSCCRKNEWMNEWMKKLRDNLISRWSNNTIFIHAHTQ